MFCACFFLFFVFFSSVFFICFFFFFFFFFQAEDGIRDIGVTGVQTCALPISFSFIGWIFDFYDLLLLSFLVSSTTLTKDLALSRDQVSVLLGTALAFTAVGDRKSTRLNSSHANISYAVFCLKKKNKVALRKLL